MRSPERRPIFRPMEKAPSGLSEKGTSGWPTLPRCGVSLTSRLVSFKLPDNHRNGLRRKPGEPGDFGLGQAAMPADEREGQAFIVKAHAVLRGATGQRWALAQNLPANRPIHRHACLPV